MEFDKKLCQKIVFAFSDSDKQFGDVTFTDEEKALLKQYYISIMSHGLLTGSANRDVLEIVTAFLICTTKNYKGDWDGKSFWDRISNEIVYRPDYQTQLPAIGKCLESYCRPSFRTVSQFEGDHRYVESLFFQAYSPRVSVQAFIELAWSFYRDPELFDLNYFDTKEEQNLCEAIISDLEKFYSNADIESGLIIESQSYSIRSGLRYAFKEAPKAATKILRRILRYIDFIYHHSDSVGEEEGYLGLLCNQYVPKLLASFYSSDSAQRQSRQKVTVDDLTKVRAFFIYRELEHQTYLELPRIRLYREDQQFRQAEVKLYICTPESDVLLDEKIVSTSGEHFKHILDEISIPLTDYLPLCSAEIDFRVVLSFDGGSPVYDSKETLFRKYVVFKSGKEITGRAVQPGEFVVLHPSNLVIDENVHSNQTPLIINESIFAFSPVDGDRISYNGSYCFFGEKKNGAHIFYDEEKTKIFQGVTYQRLGVTYDIYQSIGPLFIRTDDQICAEHLAIQIKDKDDRLISNTPLNTLNEDSGIYLFDLPDFVSQKTGLLENLLTIAVVDVSASKVLFIDHIAVLPDFSIQRGLSPYLGGQGEITFVCDGQKSVLLSAKNAISEDASVLGGVFSITTPYFSWRINEGDPHWCPVENKLPLIQRFFQSNDCVFVDSFYEDVALFCGEKEIAKDEKNGAFLLGSFLYGPDGDAAFLSKNGVYAKIDDVIYPLFYLTDKPYLKNRTSEAVVVVDGNNISVALAENFVGDPKTFFRLEFIPYAGEPLVFSGQFAEKPLLNQTIPTGSYTCRLSYSNSSDEYSLRTMIFSEVISIGDENSLLFRNVGQIAISRVSKIKMTGVNLSKIEYLGDNGFGPMFQCQIHAPWFKTIEGQFGIKAGNSLSVIRYLGKDGIYRDFSVDVANKRLSMKPADEVNYIECFSIYSQSVKEDS
jgi:hypothetical protein